MGKEQERRLAGSLRIGTIESINTDNYMCTVSYGDSLGQPQNTIIAPSAYFGTMPAIGSQVAVFDKGGQTRQVISVINTPSDINPNPSIADLMLHLFEPGDIPRMQLDECFIGRKGRAYFDNGGNVMVGCENNRAILNLISSKGKAELFGPTFHVHTTGGRVGLRSANSLLSSVNPIGIADEIWMEKSIPLPMVPNSVADTIPSLFAHVGIDFAHNIEAAIYATPLTKYSVLQLGVLGDIALEKGLPIKNVGLNISVLNDIHLRNTLGYLRINELGGISLGTGSDILSTMTQGFSCTAAHEVEVFNELAGLDISPAGDAHVYNKLAYMSLSKIGDAFLGIGSSALSTMMQGFLCQNAGASADVKMFNSIAELEFDPLGDITLTNVSTTLMMNTASGLVNLTGLNNQIIGTNSVLLQGLNLAQVFAPLINIGATPVGHAAIDEMVVSALNAIAAAVNAFNILLSSHTHMMNGSVTSGAGIGGSVTGIAAPSAQVSVAPVIIVPVSLGSKTVTVQA